MAKKKNPLVETTPPPILNLLQTDKTFIDCGNYQALPEFLVKKTENGVAIKLKNFIKIQHKFVNTAHEWVSNGFAHIDTGRMDKYAKTEKEKVDFALKNAICDTLVFERSEYCTAQSDFESSDEIATTSETDTCILVAKRSDLSTPIRQYKFVAPIVDCPEYIDNKERFAVVYTLYCGKWVEVEISNIEKPKYAKK